MYFDRKTKPITVQEWCDLHKENSYKRVAETTLPDGKWISTVWLGLDHNYEETGDPLIFETMVFPKRGEWGELEMRRYTTEEQALAGHADMVKEFSQ